VKYLHHSIKDLEHLIVNYTRDAAELARGVPARELGCYIDGITTLEGIAQAILSVGAAYIEKMKALRTAAPRIRGDTISIYRTGEPLPANAPSVEDERFLAKCRLDLLTQGFVLARNADVYQEIAAKYPGRVFPARIKGSEARDYIKSRNHDAVLQSIRKKKHFFSR